MREHRLYQADWLMRFYGFGADEIVAGGEGGMLDLEIDPKLAWALKQPRAVSRSTSTARRARCCCACRGSACEAVDRDPRGAPASAAAARRPGAPGRARSTRCGHSSMPRDGARAALDRRREAARAADAGADAA